ncbi:arylsulfatase B-like [Saccoglossus kowalevskii]
MSFSAAHQPLQVPSLYEKQYESTVYDTDRKTFAGMVSCVDEAIANITETLENRGMLTNSVIVFTTDNGGALRYGGNNWPLRGDKKSNWEGGVRAVGFVYSDLLPLDVRGTENNGLMHITDWFPTLVKLGGGDPLGEKPLYGVCQWDMIRGLSQSPRNDVLIALDTTDKTHVNGMNHFWNNGFDITTRAALKMGKWKLLTGNNRARSSWMKPPKFHHPAVEITEDNFDRQRMVRLYDLAVDPFETTDVSESKENRGIVKEMLGKLEEYANRAVPAQMETRPRMNKAAVVECIGPWVHL